MFLKLKRWFINNKGMVKELLQGTFWKENEKDIILQKIRYERIVNNYSEKYNMGFYLAPIYSQKYLKLPN